jgi:hypothetical protein
MTCPKCESADIHSHGKRNAFYPVGIVAIIGLPFAMLHQASTPRDYHCGHCGLKFSQRTTSARIARLFLILVVSGFVVIFAALILAGTLGISP